MRVECWVDINLNSLQINMSAVVVGVAYKSLCVMLKSTYWIDGDHRGALCVRERIHQHILMVDSIISFSDGTHSIRFGKKSVQTEHRIAVSNEWSPTQYYPFHLLPCACAVHQINIVIIILLDVFVIFFCFLFFFLSRMCRKPSTRIMATRYSGYTLYTWN